MKEEKISLRVNVFGVLYKKWRFLIPKIFRARFIKTAYAVKDFRSYDLGISLGDSCFVANNLKWLGLRGPAYPFDWVACGSIQKRFDFIKSRFCCYINAEDLEFKPRPNRPGVFDALNKRTGFAFPHDFRKAVPEVLKDPLEMYEVVKEKYRRRVDRLYDNAFGKNVLFIYFENASGQDKIDPFSVLSELKAVSEALHAQSLSLLYFRRGTTEAAPQYITQYSDAGNRFFLIDFPKNLTRPNAWDPNDGARILFLDALTSLLRDE